MQYGAAPLGPISCLQVGFSGAPPSNFRILTSKSYHLVRIPAESRCLCARGRLARSATVAVPPAINFSGPAALSGSVDETIKRWTVGDSVSGSKLLDCELGCVALDVNPSGEAAASVSLDGSVTLCSTSGGPPYPRCREPSGCQC